MSALGMNNDSLVRCTTCGAEEWVNFQACLTLGWPKCHGATMRLESHGDIDAAVAGSIKEQTAPIRRFYTPSRRSDGS